MRHGGDLAAAEAAFGRPREGWLDLSTGVNPNPYPLPPLSPASLARLPDPADLEDMIRLARAYYGWAEDLPVAAGPGAQAMIQLLPYLRVRGSVAVVGRTYGEHVYVWARAGHQVRVVELSQADAADVVVIVNPDNPTGRIVPPDDLVRLADSLTARNGLLVVDEAFADVTPDSTLGARLGAKGTVVLRSFGKFFGLAGVRLGFAGGDEEMISELRGELGPWPVSGPAIEAGRAAFVDDAWIATTRLKLTVDAMRLDSVLVGAGDFRLMGCDLFRTARHARAKDIHKSLARSGVWCRSFDERADQLRFGLPGRDEDYARLETALKAAL